MFKDFKHRFIFINITLVVGVIFTIFSIIYINTYFNMNDQINRELHFLIENNKIDNNRKESLDNIIVDIDTNGNLIKVTSYFDIDEAQLEELIINTVLLNKNAGQVEFNNEEYSFLCNDVKDEFRIVWVSRSTMKTVMIQLLETLILAGGVTIIALVIVSIYLTNRAIKPIKEAFEKQKQFIADASHELRTPLTIIKTNTSVILSNDDDYVKNQSKWINYIVQQTDRMSELIGEMLSLARFDNFEYTVILDSINVSKIINSMILGFEAIMFEKGIEFKCKIAENLIINGDELSIKKLFSILMDNAIKYTNENGTISVELCIERNKMKLKVMNTGGGIPKNDLVNIFERFYRVDHSRNRETGSYGLGLAIAKAIVVQYNGIIYVESVVNEYATFIVELPI